MRIAAIGINTLEEREDLEAHIDAMRKRREENGTFLQKLNGAMVVSFVKLLGTSVSGRKGEVKLTCSIVKEASLN